MSNRAIELNESFLLEQISRYKGTRIPIHRDRTLLTIGVHVGIVGKRKGIDPTLTPHERYRVFYFLRQFCSDRGMFVRFDELDDLANKSD